MSDAAVEKAKLRLADLEREIEEIRLFLRLHAKFANMESYPVGGTTSTLSVLRDAVEMDIASGVPRVSTTEEIVAAAREVLKANTRGPLHIGKLFELVLAKGIQIGGNNPKGNLSAKLAPHADLVYLRDRGWIYNPPKDKAPDNESGALRVTGEVGPSPNESEGSSNLH